MKIRLIKYTVNNKIQYRWYSNNRFIKSPTRKLKSIDIDDWIEYKEYKKEYKKISVKKKLREKFTKKEIREKLKAKYILPSSKGTKNYLDKKEKEAKRIHRTPKPKSKAISDKVARTRMRYNIRMLRYYLSQTGEPLNESPEIVSWTGAISLDGLHSFNKTANRIQYPIKRAVKEARAYLFSRKIDKSFGEWILDIDTGTFTQYNRFTTQLYKRISFNPVRDNIQ